MIGTLGYYSAYVFVIWRTIQGELSIGTLTFLAGAILQASSNIQQIFSTLAGIGDQALFLTDLLAFFEMKPTIAPSRTRCRLRSRSSAASNFATSVSNPGNSRLILDRLNFIGTPGAAGADRRERPGQDHHREVDHPALRPNRRPDSARWRRPARLRSRRPASRDGRHLSGFHAL
jgi:hypothetical protein